MVDRWFAVSIVAGVFVGSVVVGVSRPAGACKCGVPYELAELSLNAANASNPSAAASAEIARWPSNASIRGVDAKDDSYDYFVFDAEDEVLGFEARRAEVP